MNSSGSKSVVSSPCFSREFCSHCVSDFVACLACMIVIPVVLCLCSSYLKISNSCLELVLSCWFVFVFV